MVILYGCQHTHSGPKRDLCSSAGLLGPLCPRRGWLACTVSGPSEFTPVPSWTSQSHPLHPCAVSSRLSLKRPAPGGRDRAIYFGSPHWEASFHAQASLSCSCAGRCPWGGGTLLPRLRGPGALGPLPGAFSGPWPISTPSPSLHVLPISFNTSKPPLTEQRPGPLCFHSPS